MNSKYITRKLETGDYQRGFLQLLERLTEVGTAEITYEAFDRHVLNMDSNMI